MGLWGICGPLKNKMTRIVDGFRNSFPKKDYVALNKLPPSGGGLLTKCATRPVVVFDMLETLYGPYVDLYKGFMFIDDKSSWERVFQTPAGMLKVYDFKGSVSIGYSSDLTEELKTEAEEFRAAIEEAGKIYLDMRAREYKALMNEDPLFNFTTTFLSTFHLLREASDKKSHLEALVLYASITDAQLRFSIILATQLREKTSSYEKALIYQEGKNFYPERTIHQMALDEEVIREPDYKEISELYDFRNRAVHRYFISDFEYSELPHMLDRFDKLMEKVGKKLEELEQRQVKEGVGMTTKESLTIDDQTARRMITEEKIKIDSSKLVTAIPRRKHMFPPEYGPDAQPEDEEFS